MEISPYAHVFVRLFPSYKQYFWKVVEPLRSGALQEEAGHCGVGFLGLVAHPHFLFSLCFLTADAMWSLPWWILSPWTSFRKLLFPLCFVKQLLKQYLYRLLKVLLSVFLTINMYLINNNWPIKILNFGLGWVFRFLSHIFYTSLIKKKGIRPGNKTNPANKDQNDKPSSCEAFTSLNISGGWRRCHVFPKDHALFWKRECVPHCK